MKVKTNLLIDLAIFVALLVALEPGLTGIPIHEWFSLAFAGAIVVHLLLHWDWIVNILVKFFKKLFHTSRLQFVLDILLFTAFTAVMASGLLISKTVMPALGLSAISNPMMRSLHSLSANATLILVGFHFALNWNWVVSAVRHTLVLPLMSALGKKQPVSVTIDATPK
jgi:hypothetical protein